MSRKKKMMSDKEYRKELGLKCPHCGSDRVNEAAFRKVDGLNATATEVCGKCGRSWTAVYALALTGYIAKDGHGNIIEHAGDGLGVEEAREAAAEKAWLETDDMEDVEVIDSEGWLSTTGDPQWERKFYYEDGPEPEADSKTATFVVIFEKGSAKVKDSHVNW